MFNVLGLLSYVVWRYYLFFFLGTLARKYFPQFLKIADNGKLVACLAIIFLAISQIPQSDIFLREYFKFSVGGILGMTVIFALFRYLYTSPRLSHDSSIFHHPSSIKYDIVGPICESSDTFAKDYLLPESRRGDLLVIRSVGAYGETMASQYNCRELPQAYTTADM